MKIADSIIGVLHHKQNHNGYKLDLAYVTPQLIASAMPSESFYQRFYRMDAGILVKFLSEKHGRKWHIWNLQETHELGYDPENIAKTGDSSLVTHCPIPDHRPLPFATLVHISMDIREFINADPERVALVHCKCGKGRTGSLIISYLMLFHGMSFQRASAEFTQKRIRLGLIDGISILSQRRYLHYLESWCNSGRNMKKLEPFNIEIVKVVVRNPQAADFDFQLSSLVNSSKTASTKGEPKMNWEVIVKDKVHVLTPLDAANTFPADLWFQYSGYKRTAGYRVPTNTASVAFNVVFEPDNLVENNFSGDGRQSMNGSLGEEPSRELLSTSNSNYGSCVFNWDETDGFNGLPIRGFKVFDSIEIFWKRAQEGVSPQYAHANAFPPSIKSSFEFK